MILLGFYKMREAQGLPVPKIWVMTATPSKEQIVKYLGDPSVISVVLHHPASEGGVSVGGRGAIPQRKHDSSQLSLRGEGYRETHSGGSQRSS